MNGHCRFCGQEKQGQEFDKWVRDTFTDWDKLLPGEIICDDCSFWFEQKSILLQEKMGKDKPQKMQNYSHFIVGGEWIPLSKGDKSIMAELLLGESLPELAAIANSGQKHIVFRATRNQPGQNAGWVQFEEQSIFVYPEELKTLLDAIEELYEIFAKSEIETGNYVGYRVIKFGLERWQELEQQIKNQRGKPLFSLAIFLAQKRSKNGSDNGSSQRITDDDLAGRAGRLQEPVSDVNMGSVRERDQECGVHQQPGKVCQLDLFETTSDHRSE